MSALTSKTHQVTAHDKETWQRQCILCHDAGMQRIFLMEKEDAQVLLTVLQQARIDDLLAFPSAEEQVVSMIMFDCG